MLRTWFAGAISALLLSFAPLSAQDAGSDCLSGRARGGWDLPTRLESGRARGLLVELDGQRFVLDARLAASSLSSDLAEGSLDGLLFPLTKDGVDRRPIAEVHGTYKVAPDRRGRFVAEITELSRDPAQRPAVIGKLAGNFADPMSAGHDPVGRFVGDWAICR